MGPPQRQKTSSSSSTVTTPPTGALDPTVGRILAALFGIPDMDAVDLHSAVHARTSR
ncbi:hypothetical protein HMPREF1318_1683 [Actinomyces massiliensis F0489]|uniref:Uncharacterized protein n=1 Tax=Actinomyces massiliensis F0489 TaxID=1125718 RepID=J0NP14_9ACTO|nr:hypothetical protein HMPREF1318_1683 [Actinomyces massiliensis F0489]